MVSGAGLGSGGASTTLADTGEPASAQPRISITVA
jgi:hypothetical protein